MNYTDHFDHLGQRRATHQSALQRHYRALLLRWLATAAGLVLWAALAAYLDGGF